MHEAITRIMLAVTIVGLALLPLGLAHGYARQIPDAPAGASLQQAVASIAPLFASAAASANASGSAGGSGGSLSQIQLPATNAYAVRLYPPAAIAVRVPGGGSASIAANRTALAFAGTLFSVPAPANPPYYGELKQEITITPVNAPGGIPALPDASPVALAVPTPAIAYSQSASADLGAREHLVTITLPAIALQAETGAQAVGTPASGGTLTLIATSAESSIAWTASRYATASGNATVLVDGNAVASFAVAAGDKVTVQLVVASINVF